MPLPTTADVLGFLARELHVGSPTDAPIGADPVTIAEYALYDFVRDTSIATGADLLDAMLAEHAPTDDTVVAFLAMLDAVPQTVVPDAQPFIDAWAEAHAEDIKQRAYGIHGIAVDASGMPMVTEMDASAFAVMQLLSGCSTIATENVLAPVHVWGHITADAVGVGFHEWDGPYDYEADDSFGGF